jgi:hypothetical protein
MNQIAIKAGDLVSRLEWLVSEIPRAWNMVD